MALSPTPFQPARLLGHAHAQTIWPALFRARARRLPLTAELWRLTGAGNEPLELDLDLLPARPGRPGVLVLHGLESSSRAPYVRGVLAAAHARGWNGAALSFPSCGPTPDTRARLYHSGDTVALPPLVEQLMARWRAPALGAVGFSLGGNVLLKWLGEEGDASPLAAAVAISVPFDLAACAAAIDRPGLFSAIYRRRFLRSLRRKALALARLRPELVDARAVRACRTFAAFDEHVTSRRFGFAGAADYWARASSGPFLARIRRRTLLLISEDDPLVPAQTLPREAIAANPALDGRLLPRGGHVGFVTGTPWRPVYAVDETATTFLADHLVPERNRLNDSAGLASGIRP